MRETYIFISRYDSSHKGHDALLQASDKCSCIDYELVSSGTKLGVHD